MASYKSNFILRTDKVNLRGEHPIVFTLSVANRLKKLNTGVSVLPAMWDKELKSIIYLNRAQAKVKVPGISFDTLPLGSEVKELNQKLLDIKSEIERIIALREIKKEHYTAESILEDYRKSTSKLAEKGEKSGLIFDYIDKYIEEYSPSRRKGSMSVYKSLRTHLNSYQIAKKVKVRFSNINYDFLLSFQNFLFEHTTEKGKQLNNITIAKQLSTLKTFLGYAKRSGIKIDDSYKDFVIKRQKLEVIALTEQELNKIWEFDLGDNPRLDRVKDVFYFSTQVGLRYSDLKQLRRYHIHNNETVMLTTTKTKKPIEIPLSTKAKAILEKYAGEAMPIPVISNQKYNKYLQELCKIIGLNDEVEKIRFRGSERIVETYPLWSLVSAHTGRKTFASILIAKGVNPQIVMELGGWTSYSSFQRYIKINRNSMTNAIKNAWG